MHPSFVRALDARLDPDEIRKVPSALSGVINDVLLAKPNQWLKSSGLVMCVLILSLILVIELRVLYSDGALVWAIYCLFSVPCQRWLRP